MFVFLSRPPSGTLFPYTTLFRSRQEAGGERKRNGYDDGDSDGAWTRSWERGLRLLHPFWMLQHLSNNAPSSSADSACADRKSTRLNSSHLGISYAVFCLKKKKNT